MNLIGQWFQDSLDMCTVSNGNRLKSIILIFMFYPVFAFSQEIGFLEEKQKPPFNIYELIHTVYEDFQKDGKNQGRSVFELAHVFLRVESEPAERGKIVLEMLKHEDHDLNFLQAFGIWEFHDMLAMKMGKFLMPFGFQDKVYYCSLRWTNHLPEILSDLITEHWAETGVTLSGDIRASKIGIKYDIVLSNGLKGITEVDQQFADDNNHNKLFGSRISFNVEPFNFGVSYASGKYDPQDLYNLNFTGGHIDFNHQRFQFRAEYITSSVEESTGTYNRRGFYTEIAYKIPFAKSISYIQPVIRYSVFDPNDKIDDNTAHSNFLLGMRIGLTESFLFTLEYEFVQEKHPPKLSNNGILIGTTYAF